MPKLVLDDVTNIFTAAATINENNALIEQAIDNTLSRDGSTPNEMNTDIDMNNHRVYNLGYPVTDNEPVRRSDLDGVFDLYEGLNEALATAVASAELAEDFAEQAETAKDQAEDARDAAIAAAAGLTIQTVANRTALKALSTLTVKTAFLGEGARQGWFIWTTGDFAARIANDPEEGVYIKADDTASSLGAWVRTYTGPVFPGWFGVETNGSDMATGFEAWLDFLILYNTVGRLPVGRITLGSKISRDAGTNKFTIDGMGPNLSELLWTSADGGLEIIHTLRTGESATPARLQLKNFSALTNQASGGKAITVQVSPTIPSATGLGTDIRNIEVRGLDPAADYWDTGIELDDEWNSSVEDCSVKGLDDAFTPFDALQGIVLIRCNDCRVNKNYIYHVTYAIQLFSDVPSYGDGATITDNRIVGVDFGIFSNPNNVTAQCEIGGNHINAYKGGIVASNLCYTPIVNNLIFKTHLSTFNNWPGIQLSGTSNDNVVMGNNIAEPGVAAGSNTDFGVFLSGVRNSITNNHFTNTQDTFYGVYFNTGAAQTLVANNVADTTVNAMTAGGLNTGGIVTNNIGP